MATLIILVGIPASGKSTWANNQSAEVVSSDAIREELCGDVTDQSRNSEVFALFHERLADALKYDRAVIADSTGLDDFARARLRQIAQDKNAQIGLVYWDDLATAYMRNLDRERVVPVHVMERMVGKYNKFAKALEDERYLYDFVLVVH